MANEKISQLIPTAGFGASADFMLISKDLGGGSFESQKIAPDKIFYDSGLIKLPVYNGSFGIIDIGLRSSLSSYLSIRVINRTVFVNGVIVLPLSTTADGLTLANNFAVYDSTNNNVPYLFKGAGGFSKSVNGTVYSNSPVLPSTLLPQTTVVGNQSNFLTRSLKNLNGEGTKRYALQAYNQFSGIDATGKLFFVTARAANGNGNESYSITSELDFLCSKLTAGDFLPDFSTYQSGFGVGPTSKRTVNASTYLSPLTIDATNGDHLGGFYAQLHMSWNISELTTIEQIKSAIDSM